MLSPFEQATFLGLLQGLTEFLPISSDGHLALAQMLLEVDGGGLTLSVLLHTGTLLATLIYFRARVVLVLADLWHSLQEKRLPVAGTPAWDAVLVIVASVPTALIGLLLRDTVARWTEQPLATGFGFIVTALLLTSTLWTRPGSKPYPSLAAAPAPRCSPGHGGSTGPVAQWGDHRGRTLAGGALGAGVRALDADEHPPRSQVRCCSSRWVAKRWVGVPCHSWRARAWRSASGWWPSACSGAWSLAGIWRGLLYGCCP